MLFTLRITRHGAARLPRASKRRASSCVRLVTTSTAALRSNSDESQSAQPLAKLVPISITQARQLRHTADEATSKRAQRSTAVGANDFLCAFKQPFIRTFALLAHIDHGKTTLAQSMIRMLNKDTSESGEDVSISVEAPFLRNSRASNAVTSSRNAGTGGGDGDAHLAQRGGSGGGHKSASSSQTQVLASSRVSAQTELDSLSVERERGCVYERRGVGGSGGSGGSGGRRTRAIITVRSKTVSCFAMLEWDEEMLELADKSAHAYARTCPPASGSEASGAAKRGIPFLLQLVDTPGHVDFSGEVHRSMEACDVAVVLVDATRGVQAQTIANARLAQTCGLRIVTAISKIDAPLARVEEVMDEIYAHTELSSHLRSPDDVVLVSAVTGDGVLDVLQHVVGDLPARLDDDDGVSARGAADVDAAAMRAARQLTIADLFDAWYNTYVGVVWLLCVRQGTLRVGDIITNTHADASREHSPEASSATAAAAAAAVGSGATDDAAPSVPQVQRQQSYIVKELGFLTAETGPVPCESLSGAQIGYIVTGVADIREQRVGARFYAVRDDDAASGGSSRTLAAAAAASQTAAFKLHAQRVVSLLEQISRSDAQRALHAPPPPPASRPVVYAALFPTDPSLLPQFKEAFDRILLQDSGVECEPTTSQALGPGYRCGFLGALHLDVFIERLRTEYDIDAIATAPTVTYRVFRSQSLREAYLQAMRKEGGAADARAARDYVTLESPAAFPADGSAKNRTCEPMCKVQLIAPLEYYGAIIKLVKENRGNLNYYEGVDAESGTGATASGAADDDGGGGGSGGVAHSSTTTIVARLPLSSLIQNFFEKLKERTSGFASLLFEPDGYDACDVVRVDVLINGEPVDALAMVSPRETAADSGKRIVQALKTAVPRQQIEIRLQAAIGGKIIARETIKAYRKDVTAKLYGGDVTRKKKLLEKQKRGKSKMLQVASSKRAGVGGQVGGVRIGKAAFVSVLKSQ